MKKFAQYFMIALVLVACLSPAPVRAQESGPSLHLEVADTASFPTLTLRLNAWDASGLPFASLSTTDFSLSEDGGAAFHPASLQIDPQAPLGVVLALDISASMAGGPVTDAKVAAARFLDRLKPGDRAALVAFSNPVNTDPSVLDSARELDFTSDLAPVYDLIEGLRAEGSTQLYNAATKAVRMAGGLPAGHRAVLLLSDGRNESAGIGDPGEAIELARASNVPVFVIALGDQIDESYLRRLASETGGLYRAAPSSSELARLFTETATLLKTQYLLSYESRLAPDGAVHSLNVTLSSAQGQAAASLEFGPLPPAATATSVASATVVSTAAAAPVATRAVIAAQPVAASPAAQPEPGPIWAWPLAAGIALVLTLLFVLRRKTRPAPAPEVCANCGADVTGKPGPCAVCSDSRRLPKMK